MIKLLLRNFLGLILLTFSIAIILYFIASQIWHQALTQTVETPNLAIFRALEAKLSPYPSRDWSMIIRKLQPPATSIISIVPEKKLQLPHKQIQQLHQGKSVTTMTDTVYYFGYGLAQSSTYWRIKQSDQILKMTSISMQSVVQNISGWLTHLMKLDIEETPREAWPEKIRNMQKLYQLPLSLISKTDASLSESIKHQIKTQEVALGTPTANGNIETVYIKLNSGSLVLKIGPIPYSLYPQYLPAILIVLLLILVLACMIAATLLFSRNLNKIYRITKQFSQGNFSTPVAINQYSSLYPMYNHIVAMGHQLQQLIESQRNLTQFVAHDCRMPVNTMLFAIHTLKQEPLSSKAKIQVDSIREDLTNLNELINDFLSYSSFNAKTFALNIQPVKINTWLQASIDKYENTSQQILFITQLSDQDVFRIDPKLMRQAVLNLLENAIKHGGTHIQISVACDISNFKIKIEDDGISVNNEHKEKILQPFTHLNDLNKTQRSGFGLGLAIVHTIVKHHRGKITISNSLLGGACFTIILPISSTNI